MERGEAMGNREGQRPNAPTGGNHWDCRPGYPATPWLLLGRLSLQQLLDG